MDNMITLSAVKGRGWTQKMIDTLLPAPTLKQNPMYKHAAPMKLYKLEEVEQAEQTDEYAAALEKANQRKRAAEKAVETKTAVTITLAQQFSKNVKVTVLPLHQIERLTLAHKKYIYEERADRRGELFEGFFDLPDGVLHRWMVNYIRHNLTSYDDQLLRQKGKVGTDVAHAIVKNTILDKIAAVYPELAEECENQKIIYYCEKLDEIERVED